MALNKQSGGLHLVGSYESRPVRNGDVRLNPGDFDRVVRHGAGVPSHLVRIIGMPNILLFGRGGPLAFPGTNSEMVERSISDYSGFDEQFASALSDPTDHSRLAGLRRRISRDGLEIDSPLKDYDERLKQKLLLRTSMDVQRLQHDVLLPLAFRHVARERQDSVVSGVVERTIQHLQDLLAKDMRAFIGFLSGVDGATEEMVCSRDVMRDELRLGASIPTDVHHQSDWQHIQLLMGREIWFNRVCKMIASRVRFDVVKNLALIGWKGRMGFMYPLGERSISIQYTEVDGLTVRLGHRIHRIALQELLHETGALVSGLKLLPREKVRKVSGLFTGGDGWEEIL
jgi:hypothetical protein